MPATTQIPDTFGAISSPVRRQILDLLAEGEHSVNAIVSHFEMSRPAISQHLRILWLAGLVLDSRSGREIFYRLDPQQLSPVRDWIRHYEHFWDDHLGRLQRVLKEKHRDKIEGKS